MKNLNALENLLDSMEYAVKSVGAIVLVFAFVVAGVIGLAVYGANENAKAYKEACTATGGAAVYDGRQWQCMKVSGG